MGGTIELLETDLSSFVVDKVAWIEVVRMLPDFRVIMHCGHVDEEDAARRDEVVSYERFSCLQGALKVSINNG